MSKDSHANNLNPEPKILTTEGNRKHLLSTSVKDIIDMKENEQERRTGGREEGRMKRKEERKRKKKGKE